MIALSQPPRPAMSLSVYDAAVTTPVKMLRNLDRMLERAVKFSQSRKIQPRVLLQSRLAPDMFNLARQIQLTTDYAKGAVARLAGKEPPKMEDNETTVPQLRARIEKTRQYLSDFIPDQFDGADALQISIPLQDTTREMTGADYLLNFAIPNFYFHYTTAYAILRHNGVAVGKGDFIGG
jgi:hypothetical protein